MARRGDTARLHESLDELEQTVDGKQKLKDCIGYVDWPDRDIYFFFASDEHRNTGDQPQITCIGIHAASKKGSTSFWGRLRAHRGTKRGTYENDENHRGSIFRKRVDEAFIGCNSLNDEYPHRGEGSNTKREWRLDELEVEWQVSDYLRGLPFLWFSADDKPGAESRRVYIERNMIAFLGNCQQEAVDTRSDSWLGNHSWSKKTRESGLWNMSHVDEDYDPKFLDLLRDQMGETSPV